MPEAFSLGEKVAIVTGAAAGIGLAISRRFVQAGCRVLMVDRRKEGAAVAAACKAEFFKADVSHESQVIGMFEEANRCFGKVEILVNNAAIQPLGVNISDLSEELLQQTFQVNVNGVAFGIKQAGLYLSEAGRVINIASFVGVLGAPGTAAYASSKAAVIHLTKVGALELATRGVTVNAISPGTILTPAVTEIRNNPEIPFIKRRTPLGRLGQPEDVAALCHFLASDEAAYITGQNILIDGGLTSGWMEYDLVPPANVRDGRWVDEV